MYRRATPIYRRPLIESVIAAFSVGGQRHSVIESSSVLYSASLRFRVRSKRLLKVRIFESRK
jgi:hypothetical protein